MKKRYILVIILLLTLLSNNKKVYAKNFEIREDSIKNQMSIIVPHGADCDVLVGYEHHIIKNSIEEFKDSEYILINHNGLLYSGTVYLDRIYRSGQHWLGVYIGTLYFYRIAP